MNCKSLLSLFVVLAAAQSFAQSAGSVSITPYSQIDLASDVKGQPREVAVNFHNAAGLANLPGQPFFVADNRDGNLRVFDPAGFSVIPGFLLVSPPEGNNVATRPTGIVANPTSGFEIDNAIYRYIVAAENGTISAWTEFDGDFFPFTTVVVDNSKQGAEYEGLALVTSPCCEPYLEATDFHHGVVQCVNDLFVPFDCPEGFVDAELPEHYAPFGIQQIGSDIFVTYVPEDSERLHPVAGAGHGIVDVFDLQGKFLKRFATGGTLNLPWGMVKASAGFGSYANDILIGNYGDGTIGAFDPKTGKYLGQLKDTHGETIVNPGLRGLVFGDVAGEQNTLYFTAGPENVPHGLFGSLTPEPVNFY